MDRDTRRIASCREYWPMPDKLVPDRVSDPFYDEVETCTCPDVTYSRNVVHCPQCGTVYAVGTIRTYRSGWSRMAWEVDFDSAWEGSDTMRGR